MNLLIERLVAECRRVPLAEKWLLCPSRRVGQQWLDQVALADSAVGNVRLHTLGSLAMALARAALNDAKHHFEPDEAGPLAVAQLWTQFEDVQGDYLGKLEPDERLYGAVFRSIRDLRLAAVAELSEDAFDEKRKASELQHLLEAYTKRLNDLQRVDYPGLLRWAARIVRSERSELPRDLRVLVTVELYETFRGLERDLSNALAETLGNDRFLKLTVDNSPLEQADESTTPDPKTEPQPEPILGRVQSHFFRAVGPVNEVREALRRSIAAAGRLDRIELLHTDAATYVPLVYETAARLQDDSAAWTKGMPVTFAEGVEASMTRPGRALAAWLEWTEGDFTASILHRMLVDGLIEVDRIDQIEGRFTTLGRCLRSIAISRGLDRYTMIRDRRDALRHGLVERRHAPVDGETRGQQRHADERCLAEYERLWEVVEPLCELSSGARNGPLELVDAAGAFLSRFSRQCNEFDALARQHLAQRIDRLRALLDDWPDSGGPARGVARQWLEAIVRDTRVGGSGPQPGHLHLAHVNRGGHSGRPVTTIIGLDDGRFPGAAFQDPVLLDKERRRLDKPGSLDLPASYDALARRRKSFGRLLGRLRGTAILGFSSIDVIEQRELFPSPQLTDAFRTAVGDRDADTQKLIKACGPAGSFSAECAGDAFDLNEWWIAQLTGDRRVDDAAALLAGHFPHLHHGRSAVAKRNSTRFTEFDGCVKSIDPKFWPAHRDGPTVSASRLETFGTCPLRYFFRYVLRIEPPDDITIDPDQWLDPLTFGLLLHEVFHRFMEGLARSEKRAQYDRDIGTLNGILDEAVSRYRRLTPPPNEQSYLVQRRRLDEAVEIFLTEEQDRGRTWHPRYLEASIGLPPGATGTPIDSADPVAVALPDGGSIRLRARVDRIDQRGSDCRFEICDYKTGRSTAKFTQSDPFAGGRSLQHVLYLHAVRAVLTQLHGDGARVDGFHYFFPSPEQRGRRVRFKDKSLAGGLERIEAMCRQIETGAFLPTDVDQDCNTCDFRPICSATHASLADAAKQNRSKRLDIDQKLLAPMQIWRPMKKSGAGSKSDPKRPAPRTVAFDETLPGIRTQTWPGETVAAPASARTGPGDALPDRAERDQILEELDTNMLVEAAAGTGKTTMIVGRMLQLVRTGRCTVDRMAAVTFTRKAASELRDRFHRELRRAIPGASDTADRRRLVEAAESLDHCFIGTIHSFCASLLRERPVEAGVDIGFEELDEAADLRLKRQSWRDHVDRLRAQNDPQLTELSDVGVDPSDLMTAYLELCDYPDVDRWPLRCDGGPEDQPFQIDPSLVEKGWAAVRRFVDDVRATAADFPRDGGRLMQSTQRVVRMVDQAGRGADPKLPRRMGVFEQFCEFDPGSSPHMTKTKWPGDQQRQRSALAEQVCEQWNRLFVEHAGPLVQLWQQARYAPAMKLLLGATDAYARSRAASGTLNYQDLLMRARDLLRRHPEARLDFARRTTHLLVDEFQDTDPIQAEVLFHLAGQATEASTGADWSKLRPRPGSLFVVGDPKQSIYRFRRADIETYNLVRRLIEQAGGRRIDLRANFRSSATIVDWVNRVFRDLLPPRGDRYSPAHQQLGVGRTDGNDAQLRGVCALDIHGAGRSDQLTAQGEAEIIARIIRTAVDQGVTVCRTAQELDEGRSPQADFGDFMVISRSKRRLGLYARAFERYGIPHEVTGGSALNSVPQLAMLHTCMRAVLHGDDPTALVAALRSPLFGISDRTLYAFVQAGGTFAYRSEVPQQFAAEHGDDAADLGDAFTRLRRYEHWLGLMPPISAIEKIAADVGLFPSAALDEGGDVRAGSLARAIELLRAAERQFWTAADLMDYLGSLTDPEAEDAELHDGMPMRTHEGAVVRVMNLHKAKGLEAPVVFLADPGGDKEYPIRMHVSRRTARSPSDADDQATGFVAIHGPDGPFGRRGQILAKPPGWEIPELEERQFERAEFDRLLYVAATRAGSQLIVSRRTDHGGRKRSPWQTFEPYLEGLPAAPVPDHVEPPVRPSLSIAADAPGRAMDAITDARKAAADPTYVTATAKRLGMAMARSGGEAPAVARMMSADDPGELPLIDEDETLTAGPQWGHTIHMLLQAAAQDHQINLEQEALELLRQFDGDDRRAQEAAAVVRRVMQSDIWQRAQRSSSRFTEVPFCICDELEGKPRIIRGAIDLVFREDDRWVVIDYKTDRIDGPPAKSLLQQYRGQLDVYKRAWQAIAGADETQMETGIYFTRPDLLVSC